MDVPLVSSVTVKNYHVTATPQIKGQSNILHYAIPLINILTLSDRSEICAKINET